VSWDTLLQEFERLAETAGAVDTLRAIVYRAAIEGRLSTTQRGDEPVSILVRDMRAAQSANSCPGAAPAVSGFPRPLSVPSHWAWVRLCDIGTISGGHTPSKSVAHFWGGTVPWFTSKDIKADELSASELTITHAAVGTAGVRLYPPGCLLMVARSGILQRTFPVAINRIAATVNQDLKVLCPYVAGMERYLQVMLRGLTPFILNELVKTGMTVQSLKYDEFATQHFPIPPLAEQRRIVAKVDELMALCDRLEAQQQERETRHAALARASLARFADAPTPANLSFLFQPSYAITPADLRKTIRTLAVQGKLVPQDPNDETAVEMLASLARELTPERLRGQAAALSPLAAEAWQYEVPDRWAWSRFCDVAIIASNLVKPDEFLDFTHLAPDNIEKGTGRLLPCRTVREDKVTSANHRFWSGQIVYSKIRPNLAKVVVVDFEGLCSADMYPINARIDPFYLQCYMLSESFLLQAVKSDTRVAMPKINQMELNAIAVPVPPLAEQRRIVAKVEQLMVLVDRLEAELAAARATGEKLMDAVVAELTATT
jgi:type I restriction enzyme, S subunit